MASNGPVAWVQTNVADEKQANAIASAVVMARLAACANMWRVDSVYWWEGEVARAREVALHLKTSPARLRALRERVRELHPYEVPYIEWGQGGGADPRYVRWLRQEASGRPAGTRRKT